MRVVLTGGGTAGHVTPLLAVASELKRQHPNCQIRYIGNYGDRFGKMADTHDVIDGSWRIMAGKFRRYHGISKTVYLRDPRIMLRNFRDFFYFIGGFLQSVWLLVWWRPEVVFVKGGFVGLPVGLAAGLLRIPIATHDSDTVPGLTNRVLSRFARFMAVAMPKKYYSYPKDRMRHTGLPIRPEFREISPADKAAMRLELGVPKDGFAVAIIGGSLGAVRLNNAVMSIAHDYLRFNDNNWLVHLTGRHQDKEITLFYDSLPANLKNRVLHWPFRDDVHMVTGSADIVVSRAGSVIHELSAQHKPVILVPNPVLTGGHQTANARVLAEQNAAVVLSEQDLAETNNRALLDALTNLAADQQKLKQLSAAISTFAVPDAAAKIVRVLEEAGAKK